MRFQSFFMLTTLQPPENRAQQRVFVRQFTRQFNRLPGRRRHRLSRARVSYSAPGNPGFGINEVLYGPIIGASFRF
jgi:hypothetical protein